MRGQAKKQEIITAKWLNKNMSTYTQILYQIVFSTKNREKTLTKENRPDLYKDIWGVLKNKKCHLYQIGGIEDHLHIITSIHPSIALATLVKDIKLGSTSFIKEKKYFSILMDGRMDMLLSHIQ